MRLEERRWVETSQEEVFNYTADFANIENWDPGVVASRALGDTPVGKGSRFELEVKLGRGTVPMVYEITEYEPISRVVLVGTGEKLEAVDEIRFDTADNMTVINYTADITFYNFFRYMEPLLGSAMKKVGAKALDGLVAALDRRTTPG